MTDKQHGGKREGAGRPPLPPGEKMVVVSVTLRQDQVAAVEHYADAAKGGKSGLVRAALDKYLQLEPK